MFKPFRLITYCIVCKKFFYFIINTTKYDKGQELPDLINYKNVWLQLSNLTIIIIINATKYVK